VDPSSTTWDSKAQKEITLLAFATEENAAGDMQPVHSDLFCDLYEMRIKSRKENCSMELTSIKVYTFGFVQTMRISPI